MLADGGGRLRIPERGARLRTASSDACRWSVELDGRVYPSLALARGDAAATGAKRNGPSCRRTSTLPRLTIDEREVPVDGKKQPAVAIPRRRSAPSLTSRRPTCSAAPFRARHLRDKIVFVGTTALGTREVVATPLDTLFAGVEVQATVADNLLQQDFIRRSRGWYDAREPRRSLVLGVAWPRGRLRRRRYRRRRCRGERDRRRSVVELGLAALVWRRCSSRRCLPALSDLSALAAMTFAKFTVERRSR